MTTIPSSFVQQRASLEWKEILYGLEHGFISSDIAIDKATMRLCEPEPARQEEIELAGLGPEDPVLDLVARLASFESANPESVKAKWLYLLLAWLFTERHNLADPLGLLEQIYADFDYPPAIESLVRYMPMVGEDLGSRAANEARLFQNWDQFLVREGKRFEPHPNEPTFSRRAHD